MKKNKKTVLLITPFFPPNIGGVETSLNTICNSLSKIGHGVRVITYQPITSGGRGKSVEKYDNIEIRRYSWIGFDLFHKLESKPLLQLVYLCPGLFIFSFIYLLRHYGEIDIIHAPGFASSMVVRLLSLLFRKPYIVSTHAIYEGIYDLNINSLPAKIIRWILNGAKKILALSDQSKDELIRLGLNPDKIDTYTTLIDPDVFVPMNKDECKKKIGCGNKFMVFYVSRLLPKKGVRVVLEVAKDLKDINFVFAGTGPLEEELKGFSEKYENIKFFGRIVNNTLPLYYSAADLFVTTALYKECFARTILEALFCGTPVVYSNLDVASNVLSDSVAIAVNPTVEDIRNTILDLYRDEKLLKNMADKCRNYVERYFGRKNIETFTKAYGF